MLNTLILFTPALACLFWAIVTTILARRTDYFSTIFMLMVVTAVFLFTDATYSDLRATDDMLSASGLVAQLTAPSIIPLIIMYLRRIQGKYSSHPLSLLWIVAPVVLFTVGTLLHSLVGSDNIQRFLEELYTNGNSAAEMYKGSMIYIYYIFVVVIFRVVLGIELVWITIVIIDIIHSERFTPRHIIKFFKGRRISIVELQIINLFVLGIVFALKMFLYKDFIDQHKWIMPTVAIVMTGAIFNIAYTALFGAKKFVQLKETRSAMRYNYNRHNKSEISEQMISEMISDVDEDGLKRIHTKIEENLHINTGHRYINAPEVNEIAQRLFKNTAENTDEESLVARFQQLMREEQVFLNPRLSLNDVAERLHSNKTYISKLVNNTYKLGFPELINYLRIEYAQQFIMNHRDARQSEIAEHCGFLSASSFNNTFKKIAGITPKVWIASIDQRG